MSEGKDTRKASELNALLGRQLNDANVICAYAIFNSNNNMLYSSIRRKRESCWRDFENLKMMDRKFAKRKLGYKCKKITISI